MAITSAQVQSALSSVIQSLPPPSGGPAVPTIVMQAAGLPGSQLVTVEAFVALFGAAPALTYADLTAIDGGNLGYAPFLEAWHAANLI